MYVYHDCQNAFMHGKKRGEVNDGRNANSDTTNYNPPEFGTIIISGTMILNKSERLLVTLACKCYKRVRCRTAANVI